MTIDESWEGKMKLYVHFDLDGEGHKENTGWLQSTTTAFLAYDINQNEMIDDEDESKNGERILFHKSIVNDQPKSVFQRLAKAC